jgi:hypothetical protein
MILCPTKWLGPFSLHQFGGVAHQTSLRSRSIMMTYSNSPHSGKRVAYSITRSLRCRTTVGPGFSLAPSTERISAAATIAFPIAAEAAILSAAVAFYLGKPAKPMGEFCGRCSLRRNCGGGRRGAAIVFVVISRAEQGHGTTQGFPKC